jgi:predicted metalloprotease with PDZ domain
MEFLNFYNKGAITAALLDIRLLELSAGKSGLREVFLNLLEEYGKDKPFPEDEFFKIFVEKTFPEIEKFIDDYIKGTESLPYVEYFAKLGYKYIPERVSEDTRPSLGLQMGMNDQQQFTIVGLSQASSEAGLQKGDIPLKIIGIEASMENAREIFGKLYSMKVGEMVEVVVQRVDGKVEVDVPLQQRIDRHIFEGMEKPNADQIKLREAWSKNL